MRPELIKLLESNGEKITKDKNGENVPHLENTKVVLVCCNITNNNYKRDSWVLSTFTPNKSFGELLNISPTNYIYIEAFRSESLYTEV